MRNEATPTLQPKNQAAGNPAWLYALMLNLRAREGGEIWPNAGQLAHGALLAWLATVDPSLATRLHEPNHDRPFTCSSLWFPDEREVARAQRNNQRLPVNPAATYWLRLTLLSDELFRTLTRRFFQPAAAPTLDDPGLPSLRLGTLQFDIAELVVLPATGQRGSENPLSWAGYATYEGLVEQARQLAAERHTARHIGLEFRSPTAFSNGQQPWGKGMHLFPEPDRVFDRLARVWNAFAPTAYVLDTYAIRKYASTWVAASAYQLATRVLHFDRHTQVGFVGHCSYALMEAKQQERQREEVGAGLTGAQTLHLLAKFAFYAGVGQKTTMGMGQARPIVEM